MNIVIPVYNQAEFLPEAIESAMEQNVEVIVVDDGSTDKSGEIADHYPVKVIHQVNKGLASARNTGIMNSASDYILFLDSDDILLPHSCKRIQEVIDETQADVVAPSLKCFGLGNETVTLIPNPQLEDFKGGNRLGYCAAIKRSVLLEVGGYSPRMDKGYEDLHLWYNLLSLGKKIVTIPEVLWLYRVRENSMISDSQKHHDELMAQIHKDFPNA